MAFLLLQETSTTRLVMKMRNYVLISMWNKYRVHFEKTISTNFY